MQNSCPTIILKLKHERNWIMKFQFNMFQVRISLPSQSKAGYAKYSTKKAGSAKRAVITKYSIKMVALVGSANIMIRGRITNGNLAVVRMKISMDL